MLALVVGVLGGGVALNVAFNGGRLRARHTEIEAKAQSGVNAMDAAHAGATTDDQLPLQTLLRTTARVAPLQQHTRAAHATAPRPAAAALDPRAARMAKCVSDLALPRACAQAHAAAAMRRRRLGGVPSSIPGRSDVAVGEYIGVQELTDVPEALYTKCVVDEASTHTVGSLTHSLSELADNATTRYSAKYLPTSIVTVCIPDGAVIDNAIAGPTTRRALDFVAPPPEAAAASGGTAENAPLAGRSCEAYGCSCQGFSDAYGTSHRKKDFGAAAGNDKLISWWLGHECGTDPMGGAGRAVGRHQRTQTSNTAVVGQSQSQRAVYFHQGKLWHADVPSFRRYIEDPAVSFLDYPGMGIQLSSWTGWLFNHFAYDGLIRLGIVYDRITSNDPLWGSAKIVAALGGTGMAAKPSDLSGALKFLFHRLNLTDRLVPNTGWLAKNKKTPRFEYLVFPEVDPLYHCGANFGSRTKDSVFPRGTFLPVQRALGVLDPTIPRDLIVWAGRTGRRALNIARKADIFAAIHALLAKRGLVEHLELRDWHHDGSTARDFDIFRRAWIVIGPHGGQLWNAAFAKPGTAMIEFVTWGDTFVAKDCRTCGFGLANAAGQEYHIVETPNWKGFAGRDLKPATDDVVQIVDGFLARNADAIRAGAPRKRV